MPSFGLRVDEEAGVTHAVIVGGYQYSCQNTTASPFSRVTPHDSP